MIDPQQYPPGLPWGWWLRANGHKLEDEHGQLFHSVRDAFWCGHLGFPPMDFAEEQLELLLRVLSSIDSRVGSYAERLNDIFLGNFPAWKFYQCWLVSVGLVDLSDPRNILDAPLNAKGRAVQLMLQATRRPVWEPLPFADVLAALVDAALSEDDVARERALREFERNVGFRRYTFAREQVGQSYLVTLTGVATEARMPTRRVTWSQAFPNARARDDLYTWFAQRVDRWEAWGDMAYRKGADAFTSHLLASIVSCGALPSPP